jgi:hypothetical protein
MNETELPPTAVRPILQCPGLEFGAVIDGNRPWAGFPFQGTISGLAHQFSRHPKSHFQ